MIRSRPDKVFHGRMAALGVWPVWNGSPIVLKSLAEMLAMLDTFGLIRRCLGYFLTMLVGEFPPLSLVVLHHFFGASMPTSTNKYSNPCKIEKCSRAGES